jgi:hypothetical protein
VLTVKSLDLGLDAVPSPRQGGVCMACPAQLVASDGTADQKGDEDDQYADGGSTASWTNHGD